MGEQEDAHVSRVKRQRSEKGSADSNANQAVYTNVGQQRTGPLW